jgi:hypothetical protein
MKKESGSGKKVRQAKRRVPYSGEKCPAVERKVPERRIESFLSGLDGVRGYVASAGEKKVP